MYTSDVVGEKKQIYNITYYVCTIYYTPLTDISFNQIYPSHHPTVELEQMLEANSKPLADVDSVPLDWPWGAPPSPPPAPAPPQGPGLRRHLGSGSGGYADQIFLYAAEQLFGESDAPLVYKNLR